MISRSPEEEEDQQQEQQEQTGSGRHRYRRLTETSVLHWPFMSFCVQTEQKKKKRHVWTRNWLGRCGQHGLSILQRELEVSCNDSNSQQQQPLIAKTTTNYQHITFLEQGSSQSQLNPEVG